MSGRRWVSVLAAGLLVIAWACAGDGRRAATRRRQRRTSAAASRSLRSGRGPSRSRSSKVLDEFETRTGTKIDVHVHGRQDRDRAADADHGRRAARGRRAAAAGPAGRSRRTEGAPADRRGRRRSGRRVVGARLARARLPRRHAPRHLLQRREQVDGLVQRPGVRRGARSSRRRRGSSSSRRPATLRDSGIPPFADRRRRRAGCSPTGSRTSTCAAPGPRSTTS